MGYKRDKKVKARFYRAAICLVCCLLTAGCGAPGQQSTQETAASFDTGLPQAGTNTYDSADRAVVVKKSEQEGSITLFNHPTGRNYTLRYDGTTVICDKYQEAMSMAQIQPGDIVDVTFLKSGKKLRSMTLAPEVWSAEVEDNYTVNLNGKGILVAKEQYALADNVMVVSEDEQAGLTDINACDTLLLKGIDRTVYSITVEKGHGYLRLENEEYFIGGWIEIGQSIIKPVQEDMLLTVPEGSHQVLITNRGAGGAKSITVPRNGETVLDVGDLKGEEPKSGSVVFALNPVEASLYLDGDKADPSAPLELDYGIHQMIARADGYKTITRYLRVGQPYATLDIELEPETEETESAAQDGVSGNSISGNSISGNDISDYSIPDSGISDNRLAGGAQTAAGPADIVNATGEYRVYITAPESAEVYYDGSYAGVVPVDLKKEEGLHVITLRRNGRQTRSFTMQVDGEAKDISWAFSELEELE